MTPASAAAEEAVAAPAYHAVLVNRELIDPSPTNPRKRFDQASLEELADTMQAPIGIIEPLVVRPGKTPGRWELVAGERRWRAAAIAHLAEVPVVVRHLTDEQVIEIQVIENEKRKDIHALEQSDAFVAWLKLNGSLTPKTIAARIGMSERYVQNLLHYQRLAPAVREAFYEDRISAGHADLIVRLPAAQQRQALKACTVEVYDSRPGRDEALELFPGEAEGRRDGKGPIATRTCSVRDLDSWIKANVRLDVAPSSAEARLFPELREALAAPTGGETSEQPRILQIVDSYSYTPAKGEKKPYPLNDQEWQLATKRCAHTQKAVVVLGRRRGQLLDVCTAKGVCKTHWSWSIPQTPAKATTTRAAKAKPHKKSAALVRWEKQQAERREQEKLWDVVKPQAEALVRAKVPKLFISTQVAFVVEQFELVASTNFGKEKPSTWNGLVAALAKDAIANVASADDFVRELGKPLGVDLKPLFAQAQKAAAAKVVHALHPKRKAGKKR